MTVLDNLGYLFVVGGEEVESRSSKQSDVWRGSVSFIKSTKTQLARACPGIRFPDCTIGLSCWPGATTTFRSNQAATCPAVQICDLPADEPINDGSSGGSGNDEGSTGTQAVVALDSGLSTGAMVLIAVLILAGIAGVWGYYKYRNNQQNTSPALEMGSENLLGTTAINA